MSPFSNPAKLYFFFDFISHNAWLAWNRVPELARRQGLSFEPVPVLFAGLLKAHGQVGPAEVPPKSRWMLWNVLRKARLQGIPIAPPHSHPFNPLLALRVASVESLPKEQRLDLIHRLFRATWVESRAVQDPGVVRAIITEAGLDADAILREAEGAIVKLRLRENTDGALAAGVFGVPTMLCAGELFWGFDDLPQLEQYLQGVDPLGPDRSIYVGWARVEPSAHRRR